MIASFEHRDQTVPMPFRPIPIRRAVSEGDSSFAVGAAVLAVVMWSAGNLIVRAIEMPGVQIAFWRITLSAVVYALILRMQGRWITWEQFKASAPAAIAIAVEIAIFFVAIKHTTVANTTIIGALQPIVLLAVLSRFGERVTRNLVVIVFAALSGVVLVVIGSSSVATWSPRGDLLAVVALVFFSAYFFYAKRARASVPAFEFQTASWIIGSLTLLPVAVIDAGGIVPPTADQWKGLIALFFLPGTGHLLMNWAHGRVRLSLTSMLTLLLPVLSTIGAAVWLGEPMAALQIPGIAIVLVALALAIRRNAALESATADEPG